MFLALEEALHRCLTTEVPDGLEVEFTSELLLFGLLGEFTSSPPTDRLGSEAGIDLAALREQVEASLPGQAGPIERPGPHGQEHLHARRTPDLERAVTLAEEEATNAGRDEIQPLDLVIGILREGGSQAANVLQRAGVSIGRLRGQDTSRGA
jgi:ATP-dependent Clp protease ATP-binding subunit ClpA